MSDEDDPLEDEDRNRLDRVKGKRDRRSRQRGRSRTEEPQAPQAEQSPRAQQPPQAKQGDGDGDGNTQTEAPQAQQEPMGPQTTGAKDVAQSPQAEQTQQSQQEKLEPVTQREHDTFYLSEDVRSELNQIYRRVALDVLEETGVDIDDQQIGGRNRYFRPLALLVGARELREMSPDELRETIENESLVDDLPDE
ncbi:hypothetical protein [Natrinema halophilum]|uniref:hypothetical protein n=1 Tax=Natrinema halophilum TaxID=1699371 RepID=UPI001F1F223B|nr:hypothetical protein [Natrinema halophilum]UHQ96454.1 hypothetical protein HYG82_23310 [Natrinema halophilum]